MFCYKCGCQLEDDSEFCYKCGAKLNDTVDVNSDNDLVQADYSEPDVVIVKKKSKLPVVIIILLLCIFIVVAVIVLIMLPKAGASKKYTDQIEIAENYFKDEDYERAIKAYEKAIEIDHNNKDAYIGLAEVYMEMGEEDKAVEVLSSIDAKLDKENQKAIDDKISEIKDKTDTKKSDNEKKKQGSDKKEVKVSNVKLSVSVYNANLSMDDYDEIVPDVTVNLLKGYDNSGNPDYSVVTGTDGNAVFDEVETGEYTLQLEKDGFVTAVQNISVQSDSTIVKYIIQQSSNDDVIAFVQWNGSQDIDLCFFNATTKERISYGNPVDADGSFIYSDNHGTNYEMVYLRNINKSDVRSLYIVDTGAVAGNQSSSMEADGLKVSVYKGNDCIFESSANTSHSENIWYPFYVYEGTVYATDEYYTSDEKGYEWASLSKMGAENDKETVKETATKTGDYKEAYRNLISSIEKNHQISHQNNLGGGLEHCGYHEYFLADVESDGIPELFVHTHKKSAYDDYEAEYVAGYTYDGAKCKEFFNTGEMDAYGANKELCIWTDGRGNLDIFDMTHVTDGFFVCHKNKNSFTVESIEAFGDGCALCGWKTNWYNECKYYNERYDVEDGVQFHAINYVTGEEQAGTREWDYNFDEIDVMTQNLKLLPSMTKTQVLNALK